VLAGSPGKTGAAVMAAESALRMGAGLITLAGPAGLHQVFETKTLEVMTEPLPETADGTLGEVSLARAGELIKDKSAAALGPGLGQGDEVTEFVRAFIKQCKAPLVIDADGLNAAARDVSMLKAKAGPVILTPHPGEMARLMGADTRTVLADRPAAALGFAQKYGVVLVLKGAHTLIASPEGRAFVNLSGNPGLATGGTGDVLTGMVLGLLCQGLSALDAAVLGVFLHGLAGDLAAEEVSEEAMIAGDVMARIGKAIRSLRETGLDS
jgi:NAD(P)H-hydrate epimerase